MRFSVNRDDAGYRAYRSLPRGVRPVVRLDGVPVEGCETADARRGFVLVHIRSSRGWVLNARRDAVVRRRLYGLVEIDLVRD